MRYVQSSLGVMAVLVFLAASALMNAHFWLGQGKSDLEGQILAGVSVAGDLFKAMLPFFIAAAMAHRHWLKAIVGSAMFVIILAFSLMSALGFASGNRDAVTGPREALTKRYEAVKVELSEIDIQISKIVDIPDIRVVEAAIGRHKTDQRWQSSRACEDPTATRSREFCAEYFTLQARLATAMSGKVLVDRKASLRAERERLRGQGAEEAADPQASLLAKLLRAAGSSWADASTMQTVVLVLIAVMIELVAAFGLWLCAAGYATPEGTGSDRPARVRGAVTWPPAGEVIEATTEAVSPPSPARPVAVTRAAKALQATGQPSGQRAEEPAGSARDRRKAAPAPVVASVAATGPERFRLEEAGPLVRSPAG